MTVIHETIKNIDACLQSKDCDINCGRKGVQNKKNWFANYIKGEPELKENCKYYIKKQIQELF